MVWLPARAEDFLWTPSSPGVEMTIVTNSGPVIYSVVRVERERFGREFSLVTTLGSNTVAGVETLSRQLARLPEEMGAPVAAINADFFMMAGAAKGDPRGVHILRGELVSVPVGPAAFWVDTKGRWRGESLGNRLTVTWPGGGTNLAGLNEQLGTNTIVLFTPRMGTLYEYRPPTNSRNSSVTRANSTAKPEPDFPPKPGFIRPPGGREYVLQHAGDGPWLPLRVGRTYQAVVIESRDGFTYVPPGKMVLMLGSNLVVALPELTNGTPVTITAATEPDLIGVQEAIGSGPMLVREGQRYEVTARLSDTLQPRSAIGWNRKHLFMVVADGRQPGLSVGVRLEVMADFMIELGCEESLNLDGGQSSVLWLNGEIINHPSDGAKNTATADRVRGKEREVANAIVILRKSEE
jgi:hypothetical protein